MSFWVVDGTRLKVFKYSLSGSSLGNWAIDPADAHPTGITINPSNVSDVWVVDSGTLKVYDYAAAAGRTSGSRGAGATFALDPSDTNPQGIADPPPADTPLTPPTPLPAAASGAVPAVGPSAAVGATTLAARGALFALLAQGPLASPGVVATPRPESATPAGGRQPPALPTARSLWTPRRCLGVWLICGTVP